MTSVSTSCLNDSYVDFADAEKSFNVANETEIVTKSSLRWIQKEPTVHQSQQVCYARRHVHDFNSTSSLIAPVKLSRFCITYSHKPLKLTRPNGIAFNLQNPNGARSNTPLLCSPNGDPLPKTLLSTSSTSKSWTSLNASHAVDVVSKNVIASDVRLTQVNHHNTQKYMASYAQDPLGVTCRRTGPLSSTGSQGKSALSHTSRAVNMEQIMTDYYQSHLHISHDPSLGVLNQKAYLDVPLIPPISLSGQPSPIQQCCDIKSHQNASPLQSIQSSYPLTITPPTESCIKVEKEIDYSLLDEFFIRHR
ncbi:hypothetical protein KIN20_010013 [Parelaphostrongylus tenuis]|uniref:Uncharacterized protein n=1 Tax=Parelaphostrongylus tenuis TaxID=148309 RepID=A0AAD5QK14_PARTN|nr:hypothetical protein KIN20_010013 [Parelaphostrongylus tenuis]